MEKWIIQQGHLSKFDLACDSSKTWKLSWKNHSTSYSEITLFVFSLTSLEIIYVRYVLQIKNTDPCSWNILIWILFNKISQFPRNLFFLHYNIVQNYGYWKLNISEP